MTEPAELGDNVSMLLGKVQERIAESLAQFNRSILICQTLGMCEGKVEESAERLIDLSVQTVLDGYVGPLSCECVGLVLFGRGAKRISRILVEQEHHSEILLC